MTNQTPTKHSEFIPNLKISLEFVEAFFKYLPYKKKGELKYSLTYYYQDTLPFNSVMEIVSEVESCIQYQTSEKKEIEIPAEIVFEQEVSINGKEINLFYHGKLIVHETIALISWNWYQSTPIVELQLNDTIPPSKILSLFENFQTAINDIKTKHD
ncbi:MAG: hypothetical protein ACOYOE_06930 [Chlorobium sp.]